MESCDGLLKIPVPGSQPRHSDAVGKGCDPIGMLKALYMILMYRKIGEPLLFIIVTVSNRYLS